MNFLGMGPMELVLIMVLALIVFGPGKLPEIAAQIGRMVRDFRRTTGEMSSEFNRAFSLEVEESKAAAAPTPPAVSSKESFQESTPSIAPPSLVSGMGTPPASNDEPALLDEAERSGAEPVSTKSVATRRDDLLPPY